MSSSPKLSGKKCKSLNKPKKASKKVNKVIGKLSNLSLKKSVKSNEACLGERAKMIIKHLKHVPLSASKVIVGYDYPLSYIELYRNVMDGLELAENERDILKFEDQDFFENLYEILEKRKTSKFISSIPKTDIVRYGLPRLIYKWTIYIASTFKEEANGIFRKADTKCELMRKIQGLEMVPPMPKSLEDLFSRTSANHIKYHGFGIEALFYSEILDNPYLIDACDNIFEEFYHQSGNSEIILMDYFGGDWNNNLILKEMIYGFDSFHKLKRQTFSSKESISKIITSKEQYSLKLIKSEITNLICEYGLKDMFDVSRRNNIRMKIKNLDHFFRAFFWFTESDYFENSKFVNMDTLRNIIGFPDEWDQEKYEKYTNHLEKYRKDIYEKFLEKKLVLKDESKENKSKKLKGK